MSTPHLEDAGRLHNDHLIITADDFGLDRSINAAVEAACLSGILTTASLMVSGPAAKDAIRRARALPNLRVGLHLVLVEGRPTLPPDEIPDLVDRNGSMRSDLVRFSIDLVCHPRVRAQLRAEIAAQFYAFQATRLPLDHVNAHKHFHLHPCVAHDVMAIGRAFGMRAIRVPVEPSECLAEIEFPRYDRSSALLQPWIALLQRKARRCDLLVPDAVFGCAWSGAFTTERLVKLLDKLPRGLVEIYLHPGVCDDFPGHADGYHYTAEFDALCARGVIEAAARCGSRRGSYGNAIWPIDP